MASDPDFPAKLDAVSDPDCNTTLDVDSDPDPEVKARLIGVTERFLSLQSSTRDDEIISDPSEDIHNQLMRLVPIFFRGRDFRRTEAKEFLKWAAKPLADYPVATCCTSPCVDQCLMEKWLGITWVALQRRDESLCVVVRNSDLLNFVREVGERIEKRFLEHFWNAIISHIEDTKEQVFGSSSSVQSFSVVAVAAAVKMADASTGWTERTTPRGRKYYHNIVTRESTWMMPDGFASASTAEVKAPSRYLEDQEALTEAMNLAKKTSKFLLEKLKSDPSLTSEETVQTAIMATQYLFDQEFEPEDLRVFLWEKEQHIAQELVQKPEDLDLDLGLDLEELLACIDAADDDSDMHASERRRLAAAAQCS